MSQAPRASATPPRGFGRWLWREAGRLRYRLLVVNLVVVLVPVGGVEFAALYEKQLLVALEHDMRHQAVLVRRFLEAGHRRGVALAHPAHEEAVRDSARGTRMRVRVFDRDREVVVDSHRFGAPEGPEPPPPGGLLSRSSTSGNPDWRAYGRRRGSSRPGSAGANPSNWPTPARRPEVSEAFEGRPSSRTRVREGDPAALLFITEPVIPRRRVEGAVYVVRSTRPVLVELYRIRTGLAVLLAAALVFTAFVTLLLAWSISRPLARLSRAAGRIAAGERDVSVPVRGHGEVRDLAVSLAAMTEELQRRYRFASDFSADVAHELKSPLSSIRGAAELLQDLAEEGDGPDHRARRRFLTNILLDAERIDRSVSQLLELGRIEAGATVRDPVLVEPVLRATAARFVGVALDSRVGNARVHARAADLERALANLVDNALRYSPDDVRVVARSRGAVVSIAVEDRGAGVPETDRPRLFERFFTTDAERRGTGLGLAIVRAVAEAHGGHARFEPREGGGSRFLLELPIVASTRADERRSCAPSSAAPGDPLVGA